MVQERTAQDCLQAIAKLCQPRAFRETFSFYQDNPHNQLYNALGFDEWKCFAITTPEPSIASNAPGVPA